MIERYDITSIEGLKDICDPAWYYKRNKDGEWCKSEDHVKEIAKLEAELEHREKIWLSRLKEQDERYTKLEAENAKLRELIREADRIIDYDINHWVEPRKRINKHLVWRAKCKENGVAL